MRVLLAVLLLAAACGPGPQSGDDASDDAGGGPDASPGGDGAVLGNTAVYAHSSDTLYRVDPISFTVTEVAPFDWPGNVATDEMTDLAIDKDGLMIGISRTSVYQVDPGTAQATLLSSDLLGEFNGLSFVPAPQVGNPEGGPDVLIGARNSDGAIFSIDPSTGATTQIGDMGGTWVSSGDIVSVDGFGTVATVTTTGSLGADTLARLEPVTFTATPIGSDTGYADLWGVGFWGNQVFGFAEDGHFVLVNTTTGVATPVETSAPHWWGAAVTTAAPYIP